ncbi:MAG TPA: hypothetical protein PKW23_02165 [Dictyoglomaceae bacterium]|nr:hypothetical protein [Dictyoglomaceae bacterium]HOL38981.1 hypothetical protein [Dictyoglomaceae bacterium]HOP94320.1 hypothetical protein [Dictyoglomaceae bacterium]HPP15843.1 hypothetical protein [Dictyoglomaceae bacterium]HPU42832.1 hypothetical protein [Dictyoglomaceae bacterium]
MIPESLLEEVLYLSLKNGGEFSESIFEMTISGNLKAILKSTKARKEMEFNGALGSSLFKVRRYNNCGEIV